MTTIRAVLDDRRHTFITQPAVEGMLCDDCPQPHPATTEIVDDPSDDSWGSLLRPAPGHGAGGVREAALVDASPRPDGEPRGRAPVLRRALRLRRLVPAGRGLVRPGRRLRRPLPGGHRIMSDDLYTVSAGGFSATADAFARDPDSGGLWFLSMVGSQTALKAIWASLLKQPPDVAHLIRGADGMALSGSYQRCHVPRETVGTWTTKIARLPVSGGWHALVYTKLAEYAFERDGFLLLAKSEEEAPALHHRFLDRRSPLPLHRSWADWLWRRALAREEAVPLQSAGVVAYRCDPDAEALRDDLSVAVASGLLTLPREEPSTPTTYRKGDTS